VLLVCKKVVQRKVTNTSLRCERFLVSRSTFKAQSIVILLARTSYAFASAVAVTAWLHQTFPPSSNPKFSSTSHSALSSSNPFTSPLFPFLSPSLILSLLLCRHILSNSSPP